MEIGIILGFLVIIGIAVAVGVSRNKKLVSEGKIIKRNISFIKSAETFTLTGGDFTNVVAALKAMDISGIGVGWESKGETQTVIFRSKHGWDAQLSALASDDEKYRYSFQFTRWQTSNGVPQRADTMNMLLTAIEKAFLSLDPNTQVTTAPIKVKTKSSFI